MHSRVFQRRLLLTYEVLHCDPKPLFAMVENAAKTLLKSYTNTPDSSCKDDSVALVDCVDVECFGWVEIAESRVDLPQLFHAVIEFGIENSTNQLQQNENQQKQRCKHTYIALTTSNSGKNHITLPTFSPPADCSSRLTNPLNSSTSIKPLPSESLSSNSCCWVTFWIVTCDLYSNLLHFCGGCSYTEFLNQHLPRAGFVRKSQVHYSGRRNRIAALNFKSIDLHCVPMTSCDDLCS